MPRTEGVTILQGPNELGKDIVFSVSGGFGEQLHCACVIKNAKITGAVGKSTGARTVYQQAQQALDTPHFDDAGSDIRTERVYVISPFPLAQATIISIKGKLRERAGQVVFVCGSSLFSLFKDYWPDFLADESNAIERYLNGLQVNLDDDSSLAELSNLYSLGPIDTRLRKVYVTQAFHRDVFAYKPGDLLNSSIPRLADLDHSWSQEELQRTKRNLTQFIATLQLLDDWNLLTNSGGREVLGQIDRLSNDVLEGLESAWTESMLTRLPLRRGKLPRPSPEATFRVTPSPVLQQSMLELSRNVESLLSQLKLLFKHAVDAAAPLQSSGIDALPQPAFYTACIIDDFAHVAPDGVLERIDPTAGPATTLKLPETMLNEYTGHLLIVGAPGLGKTSFCRWNALRDAERFSCEQSNTLPVYIPLHRLANQNFESFEQAFSFGLGISGLTAGKKTTTIKSFSGRVRMYLDGLDEISSLDRQRQIILLARDAAERNPKYQIIVTSRDSVFGSWLHWLPRISLSGLDDERVHELVERWLSTVPEHVNSFWEQMAVAPTLAGMMKTPLLATLILLVFRQTNRLPENRTRLYDMFVSLLSGTWDVAKGTRRQSKYGERVKLIILSSLARSLHEARMRGFGDRELKAAILAQSTKFHDEWRALKHELLQDGLICIGGGTMYFSHLSFQEFLAARDFIGSARPRRAVIDYLEGDDWWREVLRFYVGLTGKPKETTKWLLAEIDRATGRDSAYACDRGRANALLSGISESYPEYPLADLIGYDPSV